MGGSVYQFIEYINQFDIKIFIISLLFLVGATSLLKKGLGKLAQVVIGIGVYLFVRGIITTGMLLEWWEKIPELMRMIFLIP